MKSILIKNAKIINNGHIYHGNISMIDGVITQLFDEVIYDEVIDVEGKYVSSGLIDIHTHIIPIGEYGIEADAVGVNKWITYLFDAGTVGAKNFSKFLKVKSDSKTKIFSLLNVSDLGLERRAELSDSNFLDYDALKEAVKENSDSIVGLKVRVSKSVLAGNSVDVIQKAKDFSKKTELPIMVHIGNNPPDLDEFIDIFDNRDVITHAFHGKVGGILENMKVRDKILAARRRGVKFDIGHGSESFSIETYLNSKKVGFDEDFISSDVHKKNVNGPVYSLIEVMNKVINSGEKLENVLKKVTADVATNFNLKRIGFLDEGYMADLFVFDVIDTDKELIDSVGKKVRILKEIKPIFLTMARGKEIEIIR